MLNDATGLKKIYLAAGYTDLRRGIDGLATMIRFRFQLDPYDKNTLFLFCGKKTNRIKGLLWEGDGFLLLYKRLDNGAFSCRALRKKLWKYHPNSMRCSCKGWRSYRSIQSDQTIIPKD